MPPPEQPAPSASRGAHGQAALLLVESLIHDLAARAIISVPDAIEIISVALDAQTALREDAADGDEEMAAAELMLRSMRMSFEADTPDRARS